MRFLPWFWIVALAVAAAAQSSGHPVRPGSIAAQQTEQQAEKSLPPPASPTHHLRMGQIKHDADELSEATKSVSEEVDRLSQGLMPKDLDQKLRHIEKLAKQLRREINP